MELLHIAITSVASLVILFLLTKLMGNKQVSQMNLYDYIVGITIGSIAAELATELESPMQPAFAMVLYGVISVGISLCTNKSNRARIFFSGKPIILMSGGRLSRQKLKKAKMDVNEFLAMARVAGFYDISQVETAILEHNGNVSFLPKSIYRPANPDDMKLPVKPEQPPINVIVDGNLMEKELNLSGKDLRWLREQLHQQGYSNPSEVFLGFIGQNGKLSCYGMKEE